MNLRNQERSYSSTRSQTVPLSEIPDWAAQVPTTTAQDEGRVCYCDRPLVYFMDLSHANQMSRFSRETTTLPCSPTVSSPLLTEGRLQAGLNVCLIHVPAFCIELSFSLWLSGRHLSLFPLCFICVVARTSLRCYLFFSPSIRLYFGKLRQFDWLPASVVRQVNLNGRLQVADNSRSLFRSSQAIHDSLL